jgi:hypothetical protein
VPVSPGLTGRLADWFDACANNDDAPRLHELVDAERIGMFGAATIDLAFVAGGFTTGAMLLAGKAAATVTAFLGVPEHNRKVANSSTVGMFSFMLPSVKSDNDELDDDDDDGEPDEKRT